MVITEVEFIPIKPTQGHIGFVSFILDGYFYLSGMGVHTRLDSDEDSSLYRIVYPINSFTTKSQFHPITKEAGEIIEQEVTAYIQHLRK